MQSNWENILLEKIEDAAIPINPKKAEFGSHVRILKTKKSN